MISENTQNKLRSLIPFNHKYLKAGRLVQFVSYQCL